VKYNWKDIDRSRILNMDETWLDCDPEGDRSRHVVVEGTKRPEINVTTSNKAHYTLLFTVFADGSCAPVVWIKAGGKPRNKTKLLMLQGKTDGATLLGSSNH
jgi:hypothetical protein